MSVSVPSRDALLNTGIESVPFDISEYEKVRERLMVTNAELGEQGMFTKELFDEMLGYIEEYRTAN